MLKAIIFDIGGVLIENPVPGMMQHYCQQLRTETKLLDPILSKHYDEWQKGIISEAELWARVSGDLVIPVPTHNFWLKGFLQGYVERPSTLELIKRLKTRGYQTAILSNTEKPVVDFYQTEHKFSDFDVQVYSCEVGMAKPEPGIYFHTLEKLAVEPCEAVFVDDKEENVCAACALGLQGILFQDSEGFIKELEALLPIQLNSTTH